MRYYLRHLFAALAAACALASCGKDKPVTPPLPTLADGALRLEFTTPGTPYESLEITEGGMYILHVAPQTRAYVEDVIGTFVTGSCSVSGNTALLNNFGTLTLDGSTATIVRRGIGTVVLEAEIVKASSVSKATAALCRSWRPDETLVTLTGLSGAPVVQRFDKCDYKSVHNWLTFLGYSLGSIEEVIPEGLDGYTVNTVTFTALGTFVMTYKGAEPYVGYWTWQNEEAGLIGYDLSVSAKGNHVVRRKGTAQSSLKNDKLTLSVGAVLEDFEIEAAATFSENDNAAEETAEEEFEAER